VEKDSGGTGSSSGLPYGFSLLAMVFLSGLVYWFGPLTTSRPKILPGKGAPKGIQYKVYARLWQDPLAAIRDGAPDKARAATAPAVDKTTLVLLASVSGQPDANARESRLRSRYAVLAALSSAGYLPDDQEYISYWLPRQLAAGLKPQTDRLVAYETFKRPNLPLDGAAWGGVLVLWARNEVLWNAEGGKHLAAFQGIADDFAQHGGTVRVLGPYWSSDLKTIAKELKPIAKQLKLIGTSKPNQPVIFSPWATATDTDVGLDGPPNALIRRVIATDELLAKSLIGELKRRGVDIFGEGRGLVALVSEWDTLYGQTFPNLFRPASSQRNQARGEATQVSDGKNIIVAHYLMGLDGRIPGENADDTAGARESESGGKKSTDSAAIRVGRAGTERPEGQGQFDYARRLAKDLRARASAKSGRIAAVGLLGSDVYDKLLLLQALRPEFPSAVFFTTDLSAVMFHPDEVGWTRNLIVASSFGLDLPCAGELSGGPPKQRRCEEERTVLPPFRDNYQTAMYAAALAALQKNGDRELDDRIEYGRRPKLYEIGRTTYHELPAAGESNEPGRNGAALPLMVGLPLAATLLLMIFVALAQVRRRHSNHVHHWRVRWHRYLPWALVASPGAVAVFIYFAQGSAEPFSLTEGISIWPSELLRLAAAALSAWLLSKASRDLREHYRVMDLEFPPGDSKPQGDVPGFWRHCRELLTKDWAAPGKKLIVGELWRHYRACDETYKWRRVIGLSVWYALFGFTLALTLGAPVVPYRGDGARRTDFAVLLLSVSLFILLTFYVLDVTILCTRFIREVSRRLKCEHTLVWPDTPNQEGTDWDKGRGFPSMWRVINLTARVTDATAGLAIWPSVVLVLLLLSRSSYFDRWDWPPFLISIFVANTVLVVLGALLLRRAAEEARQSVILCLRQERLVERELNHDEPVKQLDLSIAEVEGERRGAFAPLAEQPFVRALLLPFGGYGAAAYLEHFARLF
jgi:hypothetical protein